MPVSAVWEAGARIVEANFRQPPVRLLLVLHHHYYCTASAAAPSLLAALLRTTFDSVHSFHRLAASSPFTSLLHFFYLTRRIEPGLDPFWLILEADHCTPK